MPRQLYLMAVNLKTDLFLTAAHAGGEGGEEWSNIWNFCFTVSSNTAIMT